MPITVQELVEMTKRRAGFALLDAGLFLDGASGTTTAILEGLYGGALKVGLDPASPVILADSDLVTANGASVRRIVDWAELYCLQEVLGRWHIAVIRQGVEALAKSEDVRGGWLWEEKQALIRRISDLKDAVLTPFSPSSQSGRVAVVNRRPFGWCDIY